MDGLVIVYNGGAQEGIAVVNIDEERSHVSQGGDAEYNLGNTKI